MMVPKSERSEISPLAPPSESIPRGVQIAAVASVDKPSPSDRTAPMMALHSGTVVGRKFALIREIASGAMGTVFEAHDLWVDRVVALKLMHPYFNSKSEAVARFIREAQALARVRHPNVVALLEMGRRRDDTYYIVQEMLVGRTLREYLSECGKLSPADAISIALPIMGALAAAHVLGIVHRDVKPENIILSHAPSGERVPKLIDFGVAKVPTEGNKRWHNTSYGILVGTPHYMSPEQAEGRTVDARADIWAMGVVLFEMLTGKLPFPGESHESVLAQIRTQDPLRIEDVLPSATAFAPIMTRALQRSVDARFATMQQMREALEAIRIAPAAPLASKGPLNSEDLAITLPRAVMEAVEEMVLDESDFEPPSLEIEPPTLRAPSLSLLPEETSKTHKWSPPDAEWKLGQGSLDSLMMGTHLEMAEHALSINALRNALASTELGLLQRDLSDERCGKLWLVRSIAQRWLGEYVESARAAEEAMRRLVPGSTAWHAAFGHLVIAQSQLGNRDRIVRGVDELRALEEDDESASAAHIVSVCRMAVFTLRLGLLRLARSLFDRAHLQVTGRADLPPFVHAWISVGRAEFAIHGGDLTANLRHVYAAAERFRSAGDIRNASLQRSNIGNTFLQLGGYEYACSVFEETIRIAEPMQLDFVTLTRANLAISLANLGQLDAARNAAEMALAQARKQGNRRSESVTLVYLARIKVLAGNTKDALAAATAAAEAAEHIPAVRAQALAMAASVQLQMHQLAKAEKLADEAMQIVEHLQGIEEGEALIRLTYALVLRARGRDKEGRRIMTDARRRLLETAEKIGEPGWRKSFLTNVPDNRELLQVAEQWLGSAR